MINFENNPLFIELEEYEWFRPELSRDGAYYELEKAKPGAFFIRLSSKKEFLAISWKDSENKIIHDLIEILPNGFAFKDDDTQCPTLIELLLSADYLDLNWKDSKSEASVGNLRDSLNKSEQKRKEKKLLDRKVSVLHQTFPDIPSYNISQTLDKFHGSVHEALQHIISNLNTNLIKGEAIPTKELENLVLFSKDLKHFQSYLLNSWRKENTVQSFSFLLNSFYKEFNSEERRKKIFDILDYWYQIFPQDFKNPHLKALFSLFRIQIQKSKIANDQIWMRSFIDKLNKLSSDSTLLKYVVSFDKYITEFGVSSLKKEELLFYQNLAKYKSFNQVIYKTHPIYIALQFTLEDSKLFKQLDARDLIGFFHEKESSFSIIKHEFFQFIKWGKVFILESTKKQEKHLIKLLQIAEYFLRLNNHFGAFKIYYVVNSRILKDLIIKLGQTEVEIYRKIKQISISSTFDLLKTPRACIPSFYHILRQVEIIEDGYGCTEIGTVNLSKLADLGELVLAFQNAQQYSYESSINFEFQKHWKTMVEAIMDVPNKVVQRRKSSIVETIKLKNTHKYKKAMEEILYQISPLKTNSTSTNTFFGYLEENLELIPDEVQKEYEEALQSGKIETIYRMIRNRILPADITFDLPNNSSVNIFHLVSVDESIEEQSLEIIEYVMEIADSKPDINKRDAHGWTPLHHACYSGSMQIIENLILYGASVNTCDEKGATPLHLLAKRQVLKGQIYGYLGSLYLLIKKINNVNIQDDEGETPLHKACTTGVTSSVLTLLKFNANPLIPNNQNMTPLEIAITGSFQEVVNLIQSILRAKKNSITTIVSPFLFPPFHWLLEQGDLSVNIQAELKRDFISNDLYSKYFLEKEHFLIIGSNTQDVNATHLFFAFAYGRCIIYTEEGSTYSELSNLPNDISSSEIIESLNSVIRGYTFEEICDENVPYLISDYEEMLAKFEVDTVFDFLYVKGGQYTLQQALSNGNFLKNLSFFYNLRLFYKKDVKSHSPLFERFLNSLGGQKMKYESLRSSMRLLEYPDSWDDQFLFFVHQNHRIAFRLSTLLSQKTKSNIFGKTSTMIVYLESSCFDVNILNKGNTNVVICIKPIELEEEKSETFFVTVCSKSNIHISIPRLNYPPFFSLDSTFTQFLLSKCISSHVNGKANENKKQLETRKMGFKKLYEAFKLSKVINNSGKAFYEIGSEIGRGATGVVYQAVHKKSKQVYCLKVIYKDKMKEETLLRVSKEMKLLKILNHKNICKGYKQFDDEGGLSFLLEMCSGDNLYNDVTKNGAYNETRCSKLMFQLLSAVEYMHFKDISHRDLKPENLMFGDTNHEEIKIVDFGLGKDLSSSNLMNSKVGTIDYTAPEILAGETYDYKAIDIWSSGCIAFFMIYGFPPFQSDCIQNLVVSIVNCKLNFGKLSISPAYKSFIKRMVCRAPHRSIAHSLLEDPFLAPVKEEETTMALDKLKRNELFINSGSEKNST